MSIALFAMYCLITYIVFNSFRVLGWLINVLTDKPEAYEITDAPSLCDFCKDYQHTERLGNGNLQACHDCALDAPVRAWEIVSIWD